MIFKENTVTDRILVVDDEQSIRMMLERAFTRAGYEVITAGDADEALEKLENEPAQVMFLDLKLPGKTGIELCREIRTENPVACIYAMTGYSSLFELADCRDAGFDDYFLKPIDLSIFLKTAGDAFDKIRRWKGK